MRNVSLAVRVVVIVAVFSVSAIGQQSSPAVFLYPATSIDLPVEPVRIETPMTLADAAKHNDFPMFDAMFNAASQREAGPYAELHSFWKWSLTDPIGGFYGDDMHAKLAAEYPDYAEFIADFGIIDSHGRAFYPSAETRAFLLKHAMVGGSQVPRLTEVTKPKHVAVVKKTLKPEQVPAAVVKKTLKPEQVPAAVVTAVPAQPAAQPVATPVAAKPVVVAAKPQPHTVLRAAGGAGATRRVVAPASDARLGRGLLLIIAGLIGLGMLSLMLHAPGEEPAGESHQESHPLEPLHMIQLDEKPKKTA